MERAVTRDGVAHAETCPALPVTALSIGLDLDELAHIVEEAPGDESVHVNLVGHGPVVSRLGLSKPHRPRRDGEGVLHKIEAPGVGEQGEWHLLQVGKGSVAATLEGGFPAGDNFVTQFLISDPTDPGQEQFVDFRTRHGLISSG
jgi:hypothetical protein